MSEGTSLGVNLPRHQGQPRREIRSFPTLPGSPDPAKSSSLTRFTGKPCLKPALIQMELQNLFPLHPSLRHHLYLPQSWQDAHTPWCKHHSKATGSGWDSSLGWPYTVSATTLLHPINQVLESGWGCRKKVHPANARQNPSCQH